MKGLSTGDVARLANIRASAVRYYDGLGLLLSTLRKNGRRVFDEAAVTRLKQIVEARNLGFTIQEIIELSKSELSDWRNIALSRTATLQTEIGNLKNRIDRLSALSDCSCQDGTQCRLTA